MGIHVRRVIGLTHKSTWTDIALERFCASIGVRPVMLLQIPLCRELFVANGAGEFLVRKLVRCHVRLNTRRQVSGIANRTIHGLALRKHIFVGMR
jgi:hypothetical protein